MAGVAAEARALIEHLELWQPDVVRLALPLALTVRAEPALVRAVRLALQPTPPPETEADLWFSPLVKSAGTGVALEPAMAEVLLERLARSPAEERQRARELIEDAHRGAPLLLRLEEMILWEIVENPENARDTADRLLTSAVERMAEQPGVRRNFARWIMSVAERMPRTVRASEGYRLLSHGASAVLRGRKVGDGEQPKSLAPLNGLLRDLEAKTKLWVAWTEEGVALSRVEEPGYEVIEVPRVEPVVVEIATEPSQPRTVALREDETKTVTTASTDAVTIRTASGFVYSLERVEDPPFASACVLVVSASLGWRSVGFFVDHESIITVAPHELEIGLTLEFSSLTNKDRPARPCRVLTSEMNLALIGFDPEGLVQQAILPLQPGSLGYENEQWTSWIPESEQDGRIIRGLLAFERTKASSQERSFLTLVPDRDSDRPPQGSPILHDGRVIGVAAPRRQAAAVSTTDVLATEDPGTHLMAYPVESIHRLLEQANSGQLPERWLRSPFVGSRAFQEADVDSYFGRERELDELLRAIPNYRGVVAIEGEAGSGKTSLLRAGLLPRLPEELRALVFTPGDAPLESLARAIVELRFDRNLESMGLEKLVDALAFDDEWFANWVREYLQSEGAKTLVLIVDQFEELLRHSREEFELAWNRLLAVRESGLVALVITVQSTALDRLGRAAPRLEKSIEQRIVLGPFEPDQAERAIVEPAKMREVTVDDEFVRMITADVVGSPSLLQFVLHRLWPDLTFENYRSLGGAVGLAAERAETVYQSFASETAEIALRLLVMLAGELEAISLDEARRVAPKNVEGVDRAINSFVGIGVLDPTDPESRFYRIFDPAFPRAWPRLRDELEPPPAAESMSMS